MTEIYDRQKRLNLSIPDKVIVMGAGGIGSWVALNLSLLGVKELVIIDPDKLEMHNLNRTPFKISQVGMFKVHALEQIIRERRNTSVTVYRDVERNLSHPTLKRIAKGADLIIDCRDKKIFFPEEWKGIPVIALGYDGWKVTIEFNPTYPIGDGDYTVIPSFLVPPQFLAVLVTSLIADGVRDNQNNLVISGDVRDMFVEILRKFKADMVLEVNENED